METEALGMIKSKLTVSLPLCRVSQCGRPIKANSIVMLFDKGQDIIL